MQSLYLLGVFCVLIVFSAFFSSCEVALIATSQAKLDAIAKLGGKRVAKKVQKLKSLLENRDTALTTTLVGNNIINTMASSIGTVISLLLLNQYTSNPTVHVVISTFVVAAVVIIFGEITPKYLTLSAPEQVGIILAPTLRLTLRVLYPLVIMVNKFVAFVSSFVSRDRMDMNPVSARDELRALIASHHHDGKVFKKDRDMFDGLLNLWSLEIRQVMQHRKEVFAIDVESDIKTIVEQVLKSSYSRVPLYSKSIDEKIVGILHVRDLFELFNKLGEKITQEDIKKILHKPYFVTENVSLYKQMMAFKSTHNHLALVVDETGSLVGVITLEDILEEIIGEINDEHDEDDQDIIHCQDGSVEVAGDYSVHDFSRQFDIAVEDRVTASTVAGLVIEHLERIPSEGEQFHMLGYEFFVKKTDPDGRSIERIIVKPIVKSEEGMFNIDDNDDSGSAFNIKENN